MTDTLQTAGIAVLALGMLRLLEKIITSVLEKKGGHHTNGNAGAKTSEYWEIKFRTIVEKAIEDRIAPEMRSIRESLTALLRRRGRD